MSSYIDQIASGQPAAATNPVDPRGDFTAVHNRAGTSPGGASGASYIDQLANEGAPAAAAAPRPTAPGAKPPVPPPQASNMPIGLQFENWISAAGTRLKEMAYVPKDKREDKTLGDAITKGIWGIPGAMGTEFVNALHTVGRDVMPQSFEDVTRLLNGPPGIQQGNDLLNLVMGPLTGALTSAVGRPVEQQTGVKRDITGNIAALFAPGGLLGKLGKGEKLAKIAEEAAAAGEGGGGGGGGAAAIEALTGMKEAEGAKPPVEPGEPVKPGKDGMPPEGHDPRIDPTTGKVWDEKMPADERAARVREAFPGLEDHPELVPTKPPVAPFDIEGVKPGLNLKATPAQAEVFGRYLTGDTQVSPVGVSVEALANDATRDQAIADLSKMIPKDKVVPDELVRMNAYSLNMDPAEIMANLAGHEELIYHNASAQALLDSAAQQFGFHATAAMRSGDPADLERALSALAGLMNVQKAFRVARGAQGRAFRWLQQDTEQMPDLGRRISEMIEASGSDATPEEIVKRAAAIADEGNGTRKLSGWAAVMRKMPSREGMLYGWYNWLLSHGVIFKKAATDASLALFNTMQYYTAEKLGIGGGAIPRGSTASLLHGYSTSWREAIQLAGKALRAGQSQFYGEFNSLRDGTPMDRLSKMANGAPEGFEANEVTSPAWQYIRMAMPTSWIGAADDFAKVMNYRAEVAAGAWRKAVGELGADAHPDTLNQRYAELRDNVPDDLHQEALDRALRNTLQEPLDGMARTMQDWIDQADVPVGTTGLKIPVGRIISPFTKISANVMRFAYRSSPLPYVAPSAAWRVEMAAGGGRRALALAQAGLGTGVTMAALPFVLNGNITGGGPHNPDERTAWLNAGYKPYSIYLPGGSSIPYGKVEPFGFTLGAMADTVEMMRYAHESDNADLAASLVLGAGHAMMSKSYMEQWSNLLDAFENPATKGGRWIDNLAASFAVPGTVAAADRLFDGFMRSHQGLLETIGSRTPGVSNTEPPVRNVWGDPVGRSTGIMGGPGRALSPVDLVPPADANPIDKWTWENRAAFPDSDQGRLGFMPPGRIFHDDVARQDLHIELSTKQADQLKVLTGNGFKIDVNGQKLGAKDALNALVTGKYPDETTQSQFDAQTPAGKAMMLLSIFNGYKRSAKAYFREHDADLKARIAAGTTARQSQLGQPPAPANDITAPTLGGEP